MIANRNRLLLASAEKTAVDQLVKDAPTSGLHDLVKQYDFHHITPRQMANRVGGKRKP